MGRVNPPVRTTITGCYGKCIISHRIILGRQYAGGAQQSAELGWCPCPKSAIMTGARPIKLLVYLRKGRTKVGAKRAVNPENWRVSLHGGHSGEFCDHAEGTLREILTAAVAAGYHTFG